MKNRAYSFRNTINCIIAGILLSGCAREKEILVYTIPAEPTPPENWDLASPFGPEKARFTITDANGTASVTMTVLQGDGGGLLENVNRWRGQLGLEKLEEKKLVDVLKPVGRLDEESRMIDITGISQRSQIETRLVGVIVSDNGLTWFYKLMGSTSVVEEAKEGFLEYLPRWR